MCTFCFYCSGGYPDLHSFPTRRSSDLWLQAVEELEGIFDLVVDVAQDRDVDRAARKHRIARASEDELHGPDLLSLEPRSEEHTSELQSRQYLVCRLLLEKKKT